MISQYNRFLLHLSLIDGVGVIGIHKILNFLIKKQAIEGLADFMSGVSQKTPIKNLDVHICYQMTVSDWYSSGLSRDQITTLVQGLQSTTLLDQEMTLLQKHHDISIVTLLDEAYPRMLRHIHLPPPLLYVRGSMESVYAKRLAIIGARIADQYAQQVTDFIVPQLVTEGWQIVSGGARGADTMAHRATVNVGGHTIAVLGSGLLHLYPEQNIPLFQKIVQSGGAVISPFRLEMTPERYNFPIRNRIIAGLSVGCLVLQAAAKSGALITAEFALEQGRQVFAVPGSIFHPLSEGNHKLLSMGAKVVTKISDILEEFADLPDERPVQMSIINAQANKPARPEEPVGHLEGYERVKQSETILEHLQESLSIDQLSVKTGLGVDDLQDKLFMFQLEGKAQQTFSGLWELCS